jgi:hypothetical protein
MDGLDPIWVQLLSYSSSFEALGVPDFDRTPLPLATECRVLETVRWRPALFWTAGIRWGHLYFEVATAVDEVDLEEVIR